MRTGHEPDELVVPVLHVATEVVVRDEMGFEDPSAIVSVVSTYNT